MAHCLTNLSPSHPVLSQNTISSYKTPQVSRFLQWPSSSKCAKNGIKASANSNRDSLDHMQRTNQNQQPQQQQIKKKTPQVTPIGLWDIFPTTRTVQQMMDTMDRMMDDSLVYNNGSGGAWPSQQRSESGRYNRRTPWEIKEGEGDYKMRFDMPGMAKQDVKVWVEEKMLVVKAEKKMENGQGEGDKQEEQVWPAKGFGKYSFRIALPENIQYEKIKAEVKDGVLYINIPKASVSSKVLDINVE